VGTGSRALATSGAFLASALFHEQIIYLIFKNASEDRHGPHSPLQILLFFFFITLLPRVE